MPSRNVVKIDIPNTHYHVYARGHARHRIYRDDEEDYRVFLNLFKRHLNIESTNDSSGFARFILAKVLDKLRIYR